jgi:hypothetical protein
MFYLHSVSIFCGVQAVEAYGFASNHQRHLSLSPFMSCEVELGSCIADVTKSEDNTSSPESNPPSEKRATKHGIVVAMIVIGVLSLVGLVALVAFSLWRRKQRQEAQARFVQLFEDDDFLDEEADLKDDL